MNALKHNQQHIEKLQRIGLEAKNNKETWHKEMCKVYKKDKTKAAKWLRDTYPKQFKRISKYTNYKIGKPGSPFTMAYVYALVYPKIKNICLNVGCGNPTNFNGGTNTWRVCCSKKCSAQCSEIKEKRKNSMIEKYGYDNASRVPEFQRKRETTFLERFGKINPFQNEKVKKKSKKTVRKIYGVDNVSQSPLIQKRKAETSFKKYGVDHWTKAAEMSEVLAKVAFDEKKLAKARATCLTKYGVDNLFKDPEFNKDIRKRYIEKHGIPQGLNNGYKRKKYIDIRGKKHFVQGYEHLIIAYLDKRKTTRKIETRTKRVPRIRYSFEGKQRNYFPDMVVYTKFNRRVIEVKSEWTLNVHLEQNLAKFRRATKSLNKKGMDFYVYCLDSRTKRIHKCKNPSTLYDLQKAKFPIKDNE